MNKATLRSIRAVVVGLLFIIIVTTLVDALMHATGVYPDHTLDNRLAVIASSYRLIISIVGAYLTAKLAPQNPMKHALILGCVGIALGLVGVIATWNAGLGPRWYPISLAVLAVPQCWFGGWLFVRNRVQEATR